MIGGNPNVRAV